mmetsp:Transcript_16255/g.21267  ORF Transcript_16255/g.21267 Transcript_16255/m.21267 type:complete len:352 (+) Transcript_16255:103-1158(+)
MAFRTLDSVLLVLLLLNAVCQRARGFSCVASKNPLSPARSHQTHQLFVSSSPESNDSSIIHLPHLVVLIPAYNEEFRITETLESYSNYLSSSNRWKHQSSIMVANDGSTDDTYRVVEKVVSTLPIPIDCVSLPTNGGKGAALAYGIQEIVRRSNSSNNDRPTVILTTDADGSAPADGIDAMYDKLVSHWESSAVSQNENAAKVLIGKKLRNEPVVVAGIRTYESAAPSRLIFRWGFRTVVRLVCGNLNVNDSQCGFKMFTIPAATLLYQDLNLPGWSHDVEVLYRAKRLGIKVLEQETEWEDKEGSKLVATPGGVILVSAKMLVEVIRLRLGYEQGGWKLPPYSPGAKTKD